MRCDQVIGLNEAAEELIQSSKRLIWTEKVARTYPNGRIEEYTREHNECPASSYEVFHGMFDDEYPLMEYLLSDGRKVQEYVQAEPWSSGPCFFIALKDKVSGNPLPETLWTDTEIEEA